MDLVYDPRVASASQRISKQDPVLKKLPKQNLKRSQTPEKKSLRNPAPNRIQSFDHRRTAHFPVIDDEATSMVVDKLPVESHRRFSWTEAILLQAVCFFCHEFKIGREKKDDNPSTKSLKGADIRANVIEAYEAHLPSIDESGMDSLSVAETEYSETMLSRGQVEPSIEELNGPVDDVLPAYRTKASKMKSDQSVTEFVKQEKHFSKQLLPSKVEEILRKLWENEAHFCSLICDIQQENSRLSMKSSSYDMFFLNALLVPPNKFRPPAKGGEIELEHPQNTLLIKVLESNISLRDAYVRSESSDIVRKWMVLQISVSVFLDSSKALGAADKKSVGVRQILEKKEGILRQKMMGKRVNYACRSVISPDPYLAVNEIGIPPYFALRLTYPERVTPWNVSKLRHAIMNGAEQHPGATHYSDKSSHIILKDRGSRSSVSRKLHSSRGIVMNQGKNVEMETEVKVVHRHLHDGDIVLVNRQPTLHKPSMMAHVVRVLKGEKTLRMHYANCSTYNADFDGDEMNIHFPQDEVSRAEAMNIVNANKQYIVPTSGDPIRGLIQDHIVSSVLLTKKDTFLSRDDYHQLLYSSLVPLAAPSFSRGNSAQKVSKLWSDEDVQPLLPAIWKPVPLWTGKQVITTLLNHVTRGHPPFTVLKTGRIPRDYFGANSGEHELLIQKNEFIHGVIDKAQFGKYGLVHTVQEFYGGNTAGILLSAFSRLFTVYLQMHGFTCGVDDLLVVEKLDMLRNKLLGESEKGSEEVHSKFVVTKDGDTDPIKMQMKIEKLIRRNGESAVARLDRMMCSALNGLTSKVNENIIPKGLLKHFPKNCLSLMTMTGAKGGLVNFTQISSLLGQQELEGKRVPRMASGKTLPCFPPWDTASRAGGFISDRFLTGLRPQEYYFHCMAGRDGLVDTAVKTSRSGYLQRCLIKNLECLKVSYDHTVRDVDGSIIQFCYGEDGVDVLRTSFIAECEALALNEVIISERIGDQHANGPPLHFNSNHYIRDLPVTLQDKASKFIDNLPKSKQIVLNLRKENLIELMKVKYFSSLAQAGESVGVIAAQSVGEPSTQMTDDAKRLSAKLNPVSVADIVQSMEVCVVPFSLNDNERCTIYKLKMKLYPSEVYPPYVNITLDDCEEALQGKFLRVLEDAIEVYIKRHSRINGIQNIAAKNDEALGEGQETEDMEDIAEPEESPSEREPAIGSMERNTKSEKSKIRVPLMRKKFDRNIYMEASGLDFEFHFKLKENEPHILLSEITQKTAKKVYIRSSKNISRCSVLNEDDAKRLSSEPLSLQTAGVNFQSFILLQDDLDIHKMTTNDINTVVETYGIDAAQGVIIREVQKVFGMYGISVNFRHLSLISDFMTSDGIYRPLNRMGIEDNVSPFSKLTFETATKFLMEAAMHGEVDKLVSPSASICVGQPVKMGTGCFDLFQEIKVWMRMAQASRLDHKFFYTGIKCGCQGNGQE
ncbi:DNA-directed RNA polymerase II subunit RPB1 [Acorus gramineus]|uniref:DNA-directed RNA polymerase I subunit RPA1 n=1 Tax=Acorus gramineus TaxID=55184 RepID=A0AAV9ASA4_ACOGR|nr:DNA-directed RNA polymerase II subunit RPB1 [Acorus gramineus]